MKSLNSMNDIPSKTLLIVDDMADNLKLLFRYLSNLKYRVRVAKDGLDALEQVVYAKPDLILLDIMMPKLDGFETCRRLKADPNTQEIPVIFMSALSDTVDKVTGFEVGGVDYITKPFQYEEVMARVNTHLALSELRHALASQNTQLQQQNKELDAYAYTVAHDLKTPVNGLAASLDALKHHLVDKLHYPLDEKAHKYLGFLEQSADKMKSIIDALLLLGQTRNRSKIQIQPLNMERLVAQAEQRLAPLITQSGAQITQPMQWLGALGYPQWIEEVWVNYLNNAIKYGGAPPLIRLGCESEGQFVRFWVEDNGVGIAADKQQSLFMPFTRIAQAGVEGHGLGLSIVQRILENCGGSVGMESTPGQGSRFYFTLPAVTTPAAG